MKIKKINSNQIIAIFIFTIVLVCYISIIAPTVSFWDCGEYIAAGATFGILHPPGNPLYVICAKIAYSVFFFIENPALRINLLSPIFGAFTVLFIYLTIVRILTEIGGNKKNNKTQIAVYVGGIVGSLFAAFANTVVFSAVEAEVNVPLLLPIAVCTWFAVKWGQSKSQKRDRILVLIALICYLGIGIHMYAMIVMPSIVFYVIIKDKEKRKDWRFILTVCLMGIVMYKMSLYLFIGMALLIGTYISMQFSQKAKKQWKFCFFISLVAYLGFSIHFIIPIRSAMNPAIDMNHPTSLQSFMDYLDRKQYGEDSMVKRMFWRRGKWKNQFGIEGHMGFGGFFLTQFYRIDKDDTSISFFSRNKFRGIVKLLVYMIPLCFLFYAWIALFRKKRALAVFLIGLTLSTTIILVIYMNFGDGTRPEYHQYMSWKKQGMQGALPNGRREVRVRDYFYIAGFMYYGMWLGIASGLLLLSLYKSKNRILNAISPFVTILILLSPSIALANNLPANSRRGDYIPFNYAWNLLMSCEKDALLFTYGDNDTYPLWALQQAFGIRKDIRVVNLSLLNASWYIKHCKNNEPKAPITMSDRRIDRLIPELNPFLNDTDYIMPSAHIPVTLPGRDKREVFYLNDKIVMHIIDKNKWKKPLYFVASVSPEHFMGLEPYIRQEGMVYHILNHKIGSKSVFDAEKTEYLLDSLYKFDRFPRERIQSDKATARITNIFSVLFLQSASERLRDASLRKGTIDKYIVAMKSDGDKETLLVCKDNINQELILMEKDIKKGLSYLDRRGKIFPEIKYSKLMKEHFTQLEEYSENIFSILNGL